MFSMLAEKAEAGMAAAIAARFGAVAKPLAKKP
jgi:hypothetical protein